MSPRRPYTALLRAATLALAAGTLGQARAGGFDPDFTRLSPVVERGLALRAPAELSLRGDPAARPLYIGPQFLVGIRAAETRRLLDVLPTALVRLVSGPVGAWGLSPEGMGVGVAFGVSMYARY